MENSVDFFRMLVFAGIVIAALLLFVLFCVALNLWAKRREEKRNAERERKLAEGITARARIVDLRRSDARRLDFTLFRVLLEITPADLEPFSTAVVWEIEPSAMSAMQPGVVVPVRFHRSNMREIHPSLAGARYSDQYQFAKLFIENDIDAPSVIAAERLAPPAPKENMIYRRRSRVRIFGLPLWEIAFNLIRRKGNLQYAPRNAQARAVIAIGDSAVGFVAIGGFARGVIACGHFAVGLVAGGSGAFGVFGIGLMSFGVFACGALSAGFLSLGAITAGFASVGWLTIARYAFSRSSPDSDELLPFYNIFKNLTGLSDAAIRTLVEYGATAMIVTAFAFFIGWFILRALLDKYLEPNDNRLDSPRR